MIFHIHKNEAIVDHNVHEWKSRATTWTVFHRKYTGEKLTTIIRPSPVMTETMSEKWLWKYVTL